MLLLKKDKIKKVFLLEDDEDRIKWFKETFSFAYIFQTKEPPVAIQELKDIQYDVIFLDHDLQGYMNLSEDNLELTGTHVIGTIKDTKNSETQIIIHSMNPIGGKRMMNIAKDSIWVPFGELVKVVNFI